MQQHLALQLLPQVARRIDDLQWTNFHVPVLMHQERVLQEQSAASVRNPGHIFSESDYVDARTQYEYLQPDFALREVISVQDVARLQAINDAFADAIKGKTIVQSQLRKALTTQQLAEFEQYLNTVEEPGEILYGDGMPEPLRDYNIKLNKADLMWARYERVPSTPKYGSKQRRNTPGQLEDRAQSLYEDALECLDEIFSSGQRGDWGREMPQRLLRWMDRDFELGINGVVGPDPHSVPRVRGSKSIYAHDSGLPKLSARLKRQYCALRALLLAAVDVAFNVPAQQAPDITAQQANNLKLMLKRLRVR